VAALCRRVVVIAKGVIVYDGSLGGIIDEFSGHKVVTLQLADTQGLDDLGQYGQVLELRSPKAKLKIPRAEVPKALAAILARHTVEDVVVEDPPLEAVIAEVFTQAALEDAAEEADTPAVAAEK
jgi:ABC-2 type transport system ATP-binding protein